MTQNYETEEDEGAYEDEEFQVTPLTSAHQQDRITEKGQFAASAWSTSDSRGIFKSTYQLNDLMDSSVHRSKDASTDQLQYSQIR